MNIIIVDDEHIIRQAVLRVIEDSAQPNWRVVAACGTAREAVAALQANDVNVVISDIKMPGMDGIELLKYISLNKPGVAVIFLTGYDDFAYAQNAIRYKAMDYILKPMNPKYLISILMACQDQLNAENQDADNRYTRIINDSIAYIKENYSKNLTLVSMGEHFHLNPQYFSELFKKETGVNYIDYLTNHRINKAKQLIKETPHFKIYEISSLVGYENPKYFCKLFKKICGVTPQDYKSNRNENKGR